MFKKKNLWIYCIVGFFIYSINELLIYMFIDDAKQNFFHSSSRRNNFSIY